MRKSGKYDLVPNNTTVEREMQRIKTRQDLYQREKELKRINLNVNPKAQDPVEYKGAIVPRYLKNEISYSERTINEQRRQVKESLFPNFDEMEPLEQAMHEASGNIGDLEGDYSTPDDLDDLTDQKYSETDAAYMSKYLEAWHEYCTLSSGLEMQVEDNIMWLMENRPGAIREILDRGYIQAQIEYIYIASADLTDAYVRHKDIVEFWSDMVERYE